MAKAVDFTMIDELEKLLAGRMPAGVVNDDPSKGPIVIDVSKAKPIQKEKTVYIEDTPLAEGEAGIQTFERPETSLGRTNRKNRNALIKENYDQLDKLEGKAQKSDEDFQSTRSKVGDRASQIQELADAAYDDFQKKAGIGGKLLLAQARGLNAPIDIPESKSKYDASSFQSNLKSQLDQLSKTPEQESTLDQMITGLGPLLVGLAGGGDAGMNALKFSTAELDRVRKAKTDERKSKIENIGKQIEGTGKLLSAEAEMNKANAQRAKDVEEIRRNKLKDFQETWKTLSADQKAMFQELLGKDVDLQKSLMGADQKQSQDANKAAETQFKESNDAVKEGIDSYIGTEQKVLDNEEAAKRAKIAADAAEKRAAVARAEKSPTDAQAKSAEAYTAMTKAGQAYDRMLKDTKTPPSMGSAFFDAQKSLFENNRPGLVMGDVLKQVSDPETRRQIQIELDWLAPKLRKDSGAAISVSEYIAEGNRYFPRKGDNSKTIAEKEASRRQAVENFKYSAGRAPMAPIQQPDFKSQELSREQKINRIKQLEGK